MDYRINGFEQIKSFYSWVFNNPEKARPTHISLYLFLLNQGNRANWVEWFKCPYDLAMQGACIGNNGTYYRCLDDLKTWKLIDYKKGTNNYKAPLVKLFKLYKSEHLTEQVTVPLSEQQTAQQYAQQHVHIYKLITNNVNTIEANFSKFENFIKKLGVEKPKKQVTVIPWKENYEIYREKCAEVFKRMSEDESLKREVNELYPKIDFEKSLAKSFLGYWSTEDGWNNKRKRDSSSINWRATIIKTINNYPVLK